MADQSLARPHTSYGHTVHGPCEATDDMDWDYDCSERSNTRTQVSTDNSPRHQCEPDSLPQAAMPSAIEMYATLSISVEETQGHLTSLTSTANADPKARAFRNAVQVKPLFRRQVLQCFFRMRIRKIVASSFFPFALLPQEIGLATATILVSDGYLEIMRLCKKLSTQLKHLVSQKGIWRLKYGPAKFATCGPLAAPNNLQHINNAAISVLRIEPPRQTRPAPANASPSSLDFFSSSVAPRERCVITIYGLPGYSYGMAPLFLDRLRILSSFKTILYNIRCINPQEQTFGPSYDFHGHSQNSPYNHLFDGAKLFEPHLGPFYITSYGAVFHPNYHLITKELAHHQQMNQYQNPGKRLRYREGQLDPESRIMISWGTRESGEPRSINASTLVSGPSATVGQSTQPAAPAPSHVQPQTTTSHTHSHDTRASSKARLNLNGPPPSLESLKIEAKASNAKPTRTISERRKREKSTSPASQPHRQLPVPKDSKTRPGRRSRKHH